MISCLTFSLIAALLVLWLGRRDCGRDPRLTLTLLVLLAAYPMMWAWMPKLPVLPTQPDLASTARLPWGRLLAAVWLTGFLFATARLLLSLLVLRRWKHQSVPVQQIDGIEIRKLSRLSSPIAAGIFHRVVYVPESWDSLPAEAREIGLAHELTHHRRLDPLWRLCAAIACAIHWFNPLVHWMARRLILQCELACDAEVLGQGASGPRYAQLLCDFASSRRQPMLAIAMAGRSTLEQRVRRIMNPVTRAGARMMIACGLIGMGSALALSMLSTTQQVIEPYEVQEVELRLSADPFPGNP